MLAASKILRKTSEDIDHDFFKKVIRTQQGKHELQKNSETTSSMQCFSARHQHSRTVLQYYYRSLMLIFPLEKCIIMSNNSYKLSSKNRKKCQQQFSYSNSFSLRQLKKRSHMTSLQTCTSTWPDGQQDMTDCKTSLFLIVKLF